MERFIPSKRIAIDGCAWWCIWDKQENRYSTYTCHGKYKTRKEAQFAIKWYAERGWYNV